MGLTATITERELRQRGPALGVRRYGRNDFEKFNEDTARGSHLRVGHGTIGKVDIDCKYHWTKAQWGTLKREQWGTQDHKKNPAGIVYMDITFKQPHGYWLERASVYITLSQDTASYALKAPRRSGNSSHKSPTSLDSDYAVQICEYGPSCIIGPPTTGEKTVSISAKPSIGATGVGEVSGVGRESGLTMEISDRWVFRGMRPGPGCGGDGLRTLEWELKENKMDPSQVHNREYNTAFAFEHSQRPVFMRVEVKGELSSKRQKFKHKFATFGSNIGKEDKSTLTHINFNKAQVFENSLDNVAKVLDKTMWHENSCNRAVEMPGPMQANFAQDSLPSVDGEQQGKADEPERLEAESKDEALLRCLRDQLDDRPTSSTSPSTATSLVEEKGQVPVGTVPDPTQQELLMVPILIFIKQLLGFMAQLFGRPIPRPGPQLPPAPSPPAAR